jgi:hypothetical protein
MEKFEIEKDVNALCVQAASFPMGVGDAFSTLNAKLAGNNSRQLYGISHPAPNGVIIYRAAAEEIYPGEGEEKGLEFFLIRKGIYISLHLTDWKKDEMNIGRSFVKLLAYPGIDPNGYCLEIYNGNNVRCLVPLS